MIQTAIRFNVPLIHAEEPVKPLCACISGANYWIYYPQTPGSKRLNTINLKGSYDDLIERVPSDTRIFDVEKVSVKVFWDFKMRDYDRELGRASKEEFIKALLENGAMEL